jgi:hypothetical protein
MKGQLNLAFEMKMKLEIIQIDPDGGSRTFHYFLPYIFDDFVGSHFYPIFVIPRGSGNPVKSSSSGLPPARERHSFCLPASSSYLAAPRNSFEGRDNLKKTYGIYRLVYISGVIISIEIFNDGEVMVIENFIIS